MIGNVNNIYQLKAHVPDNKFKGGGVQHSYTLLPSFSKDIKYAILNSPKLGTFERERKTPKTSIYGIERAKSGQHKGEFLITVGMNLTFFKVLLGDEYLMNSNNYARSISKETNDTIWYGKKIIKHNVTPTLKYTHNLQMIFKPTDRIFSGVLNIALRNQLPQWIYDMNDDEGLNIKAKDSINKTFGIKYLVEGVFDAYNFSGNTIYTNMKLNLKK